MKKKISFDVDGTLINNKDIQEFCKKLCDEGLHEIYILTRRFEESYTDIRHGDEHTDVFNLASSLGIKKENVVFLNREYKYDKINELDIKIHIDDDPVENAFIREHCVMCIAICVDKFHNKGVHWKDMFEELLSR